MTGIYVGGPRTDYSAMQGPAPDGFHVPLSTERQAVKDIWTALGGGSDDGTNFGIALKLPFAGSRGYSSAGVSYQGASGRYWSSSRYGANSAYCLNFTSTALLPQNDLYRAGGFSVRCFKNSPVVPTSSWTKLYGTSIESGGIFWSSADGLISLSSDGSTWITIQDKNLGATQVWNSGDTVSEANCGKYYQRGNNYGFAWTGSLTTSSTQVNASTYGPGNYYSSSTFITRSSSPYRWDSTDNGNLRGGVTGIVEKTGEIKNIYVGTTPVKEVFVGTTKVRPSGWKPGANTVAYYSFNGDINDHSGNGWDLTYGPTSYTTLSSGIKTAYFQGLYRGNCPRALLPVVFNKGDLTISMRVNPGSNPARVFYFEAYDSWRFNSINIYNNKLQFEFGNGSNGGQNFDATTTNTQGTWYNIVLTYNSNSNTWAWNKNGTQLNTTSGLTYPTWTSGNFGSIGFTADQSWSSNNKDTLSELIIENKARTAQEISNYYNSTKSNYGL